MKKIRSRPMFLEVLDDEYSWRVKEIADVKSAIRDAEDTSRKSLIRAGVPILYAHWEGFIKSSSEALLNFINNQGCSTRSLSPCFIVYGAKRMIRTMIESGNAVENIAVVEYFLNKLDDRAELATIGAVNTESNLSSRIFDRIARSLGIDTSSYETKYMLIDSSLLDRRNTIAHGMHLDVNREDFVKLSDEVIWLIRSYKTDLENIVHTDRFKSAQVVVP